MLRKNVVALSIAALSVASVAAAQENATFTLKSGEKMSGQLMDLGGGGFTVRVDGQERQIGTNDLAVIDFTGAGTSQSDWDRLNSGQFAVLRDGSVVTGQLTDVGGSSPLRLSFSVGGANRDLQSNQVAKIVLARPNDGSAPNTGGTAIAPGVGEMSVPATQAWTPTGMRVARGETLTFTATGEVKYGGGADQSSGLGGSNDRNNGNPLPNVGTGALIGRIGTGAPFAVNSGTRIQAPIAGELFLGINDTTVTDNQGAYQVKIERSGRRR